MIAVPAGQIVTVHKLPEVLLTKIPFSANMQQLSAIINRQHYMDCSDGSSCIPLLSYHCTKAPQAAVWLMAYCCHPGACLCRVPARLFLGMNPPPFFFLIQRNREATWLMACCFPVLPLLRQILRSFFYSLSRPLSGRFFDLWENAINCPPNVYKLNKRAYLIRYENTDFL